MSTVLFVICTIALVVDGRPHDHDLEDENDAPSTSAPASRYQIWN